VRRALDGFISKVVNGLVERATADAASRRTAA
jgi:hypothetical protein